MASRDFSAAAALLEALATSQLTKGCGPLEQLCQGVAAAKRLARDACPGLDHETHCGGAGAGTAARTQAAVEAALQLASEALSARLGRDAGSSGEEAGSGRVAVAAQLLRLAAEGPGQSAGRGPSGAAGEEADARAAALAALDCLGIEDLGSLPHDAFCAALLLRPALLDGLIEQAARDVCGAAAPGLEVLRGRAEWRRVPAAVAAQPALLQRLTSTLLSWWQLSGHPRLWLLLSATCRPAWQLLLPAAEAGSEAAATQPQPNHHQQQQQQQQQQQRSGPMPEACVQLFCCDGAPLELARLLLATPTRAALRQLLAALPGRGGTGGEAGGCANSCQGDSSLCGSPDGANPTAWPSQDEWRVQWDEGAELERKQQQQQRVKVAAAWRLVMQHRCWYEYAVWLLAHSSLRVLLLAPLAHKSPGASPPQQQPQQQQQQAPATQQPWGTRQQLGAASGSGRDDALRDAALAAEFVAWMVAPSCAERQGTCAKQLLGCIDAAASAAAADTPDTAAAPAPGTSALPAAAAADALLAAWRPASRGGANGGSGACWPWWLGSVDLPAALLQHPSVLLCGLGPALLAEWQGGTTAAGINTGSTGASRGSGMQLLDQTVLGGVRDALEAVSAAVLELLQPAAAHAPAGGSGSGGASAGAAPASSLRPNPQQPQLPNAGGPTQAAPAARGRTRRSWLAGCVRHVLTAGGLPLGEGSSQPQAVQGQGAQRVLAPRLRQLLAAAQACQDAWGVTAN